MKTLALIIILLQSVLGTTAQVREIKIGVNLNAPPFGFIDTDNDSVGIDIEIARRIGKALHAKVKLEHIDGVKSRENRLKRDGDLDFIVGTYSITPERKKEVTFSLPYFHTDNALALLAYRKSNILRISDLRYKSFCFVERSTASTYYETNIKPIIGNENTDFPLRLENQKDAFKYFFSERVNAIIDDAELLHYYAEQAPGTYRLIELNASGTDDYGVGINERNLPDTTIINTLISNLKRTNQYGESAIDRWKLDFRQRHTYSYNKKFVLSLVLIGLFVIVPGGWVVYGKFRRGRAKVIVDPNDDDVKGPGGPGQLLRNNYAWIIANSDYQYQQSLADFPFQDAEKLSKALQAYNFLADNIYIQRNATTTGIKLAFQHLQDREKSDTIPFSDRITDNDSLLIYYSGHGYFKEGRKMNIGYWVPTDARATHEYIEDIYIRTNLNRLGINHVLLISDSCFAGRLFDRYRDAAGTSALDNYLSNPCIDVITSGSKKVPAESKFAKKLIDILETNADRFITTDDLALHLKQGLRSDSRYNPQYGSVANDISEGRFVFLKSPAEPIIGYTAASTTPNETPAQEIEVLRTFRMLLMTREQLRSALNFPEEKLNEYLEHLKQQGLIEECIVEKKIAYRITKEGKNKL